MFHKPQFSTVFRFQNAIKAVSDLAVWVSAHAKMRPIATLSLAHAPVLLDGGVPDAISHAQMGSMGKGVSKSATVAQVRKQL